MRTDKLITIIFSVILGIIGLFTLYIMGSSFLYDAGIIGNSDEYVSLKTILEEQKQAKTTDSTDVEEDTLSASPSVPSENEDIAAQENQQDEAVEALIALGYSPQDAAAALARVPADLPLEARIKQALKR